MSRQSVGFSGHVVFVSLTDVILVLLLLIILYLLLSGNTFVFDFR